MLRLTTLIRICPCVTKRALVGGAFFISISSFGARSLKLASLDSGRVRVRTVPNYLCHSGASELKRTSSITPASNFTNSIDFSRWSSKIKGQH